jgi:hypothetical protein
LPIPFAVWIAADSGEEILKEWMAVMSVDQRVALDLDDLPMDIFELTNQGLEVESLNPGHGINQNGTSCGVACSCCCLCPGCSS